MPLCGAGCKLSWGEPVKAGVRASGVVVETPAFDDAACRLQAAEEMLVQALVAQAPDKALYKAILHGLARRDVVALDAMLLLPFQDGVGGEFSAVIANNQAGITARLCDPVEFARNADA